MAKNRKTFKAYEVVKELSRCEAPVPHTERAEPVPYGADQKVTGKDTDVPAKDGPEIGLPETYGHWQKSNVGVYEWTVDQVLNMMIDRVDPELKTGNPVWHWCLADDHCTFIFRNGQKVTVTF